MSGGSMNYLYSRIESEAQFSKHTIQRRAFASHLEKVCKALHDIEWVDSCDYGPGDENAAIMACIKEGHLIEELINEGNLVIRQLTELLENQK